MVFEENIALAPLSTFSIGGRARFFARATSLEEIREALAFARERTLPLLVLGGGSNVLFDDGGWDGLVLKIEIGGIETEGNTVRVGAGVPWDVLVTYCVERGLWGIENLSAIPGTVGGAVVQNIGAYGAALSEMLCEARVLDTTSGDVRTLSNADCAFDYRDSVFKHRPELIVLEATSALSAEPEPNLSYRDLAERFGGRTPSLREIRDAVVEIRRNKFPDVSKEGTAGSFFKNPIVTRTQAQELKIRFPEMPLFDMPETDGVKVPLAWLLDKQLAMRGYAHGGARLFEKQPLVIAAARGTPATDVRALAQEVVEKARDAFGISLEPEVRVIENCM